MKGIEIKKLRQQFRWMNQETLSQIMGVHSLTISKWERGILKPNMRQVEIMNIMKEMDGGDLWENQTKIWNAAHHGESLKALYLILKTKYEEDPQNKPKATMRGSGKGKRKVKGRG